MKTINDRKSHLLATAGALHESGRYDDLKERLETDVVLSAAWVAIIALYVVMAWRSIAGTATRRSFRQTAALECRSRNQ